MLDFPFLLVKATQHTTSDSAKQDGSVFTPRYAGMTEFHLGYPDIQGCLPAPISSAKPGGGGSHGLSYQRSPVERCNVSDAHFRVFSNPRLFDT